MNNVGGINILQIVKGLDIGGKNGGAESFGLRLALHLRKINVNVTLCAFTKHKTEIENGWQRKLENQGVRVFYASEEKNFDFFKARQRIKKWLCDHPMNVVHSHYQVGTITCVSLKHSNSYQSLVRTAHIDMEFGKGILAILSRVIFQYFLYPLLVDQEVGVSKSITRRLNAQVMRSVLHKPAIWIPNAISDLDDSEINDGWLVDIKEKLPDQPWFITSIGVLISRKNIDVLIRAIPEIIPYIPNARLLIVGDGPERLNLEYLTRKLNLSQTCLFLGQQKNIKSILEKSKIIVVPSSVEGISTVILEAFQHKVPVIASDISGNRELIQDGLNGRLIQPQKMDALATAIIEAYQHPEEFKRMAEAAHAQTTNYSMSTIGENYLDLYSALIQKRKKTFQR